ncbi:MAG TPA: HD domain-containing protein, partial [Anaeromyxobacteraceae bacterium]|nr:HD domain-containing protein [Anaeromyxobacteraceae bacterium]
MEKIWAKDVKEGERPKSLFLVTRKAILTAKSGKTYLAVTFQDKTGELEGRAFEKIEELAALFEEKDTVEVEGIAGTFQGRPQLKIETIARVDAAALDPADFAWVRPPEVKKPEKAEKAGGEEALWAELLALVEAVADPHVRTLIKAFTEDDDVAARLRRDAAAKTVHHAYPGGLLEHTVSCLKLAHRIADHYPQVDRDLLVAGAFFHDIGKIRELSLEKNAEYTDEGRLVGHVVMAAQWIHDKARRTGVPRDLEHQIVHIVLAHHGRQEYGSPRPPMTLEAAIVHYIDDLDSRVNSWLNLMGREGGSRRWTNSDNVYEQPIWRGAMPTTQAEKRGPAPEILTPMIYVPRQGRPEGQRKPKQKPPRPPQEHKAPAEAKPAEGGAPAEQKTEAAPQRTERPPRPDRPDRGGFRGGPGFGDKKTGYQGPRLPGDKGPSARPTEKKL